MQVNWTIPDWRRLPRQLLLAVLLPALLSSAGCAAFLARTGDQASLLVDEVLGGLPLPWALNGPGNLVGKLRDPFSRIGEERCVVVQYLAEFNQVPNRSGNIHLIAH